MGNKSEFFVYCEILEDSVTDQHPTGEDTTRTRTIVLPLQHTM